MYKPVQITIPTPCHEKWDEMTPTDKGKFCAACQKNVIDFTKATDREIVQSINGNKNLCGRFSPSQLDRDLIVPKEKSTAWTAVAAGIISFITLGVHKATAQETVKTEQTDVKTDSIAQENLPEKWIVTGTVSDELGALPSTNIIVKGTTRSTQTDIEGNYSIEVEKGDVLQFSYIAHNPVEVTINSSSEINITLTEQCIEHGIAGGIMIRRSFFGRIFHSIGNIFR
ncbi:carboxypeptidase-like regulatory domain-containing protein [Flavobacterium sp. C4GT6]|uniref:carboxypeptidase-like regulatory domain-containing protein n=1 Tax=Flavobacterium sp. C4GT6 TaxID=3103818 RepID=UPI002ED0F979